MFVRGTTSDPAASYTRKEYSSLAVEVMMQTRPGYYLHNIVLIETGVSLLSLWVYVIPPSEFDTRMQISLSCLLTSVAFKFVASDKLPTISYLTWMDRCVREGPVMSLNLTPPLSLSQVCYIWNAHVRAHHLPECYRVLLERIGPPVSYGGGGCGQRKAVVASLIYLRNTPAVSCAV